MLQTFKDQYDERCANGGRSTGFFLWTFTDTSASIVEQHFVRAKEMAVKNMITEFTLAAIVGLIVVLPFVILEYINTQGFRALGFPVALFSVMWLLPFVFVFLLMPTVRDIRSGAGIMAHPASVFVRAVLMIAIGMFWVILVNDQMPCFMGVPNCD